MGKNTGGLFVVVWLGVGAHTLAHWVVVAVFVVLAVYAVSLFFRRKGFFVWAEGVAFCFFCPIFFLYPRIAVLHALALSTALLLVVLFFSPVLLFRRGKRGVSGQTKITEKGEAKASLSSEFTAHVAPMPEFIGRRSVQFGCAFEMLDRLERAKLNGRDRMETDVIRNMLTVYAAKERLSCEETHALNGYLASLLKLMAAYSV